MNESPSAQAAKEAVPGLISQLEKFKIISGNKFNYFLDKKDITALAIKASIIKKTPIDYKTNKQEANHAR